MLCFVFYLTFHVIFSFVTGSAVGYWSLDMILERSSFTRSDCRVTSLHYGQRSFILDLLILSIEWISTVLSHTARQSMPPCPSSRLHGS